MSWWTSARAKMRQRAQPLLEPDEHIEKIFPAGVGHGPWKNNRCDDLGRGAHHR